MNNNNQLIYKQRHQNNRFVFDLMRILILWRMPKVCIGRMMLVKEELGVYKQEILQPSLVIDKLAKITHIYYGKGEKKDMI